MKKTLLLLCAFSLLEFGCSGLQKTTSPNYSELERRVEKSGLDIDLNSNNMVDEAFGGVDRDVTDDVSTMLGSANNSAIRTNIGLAIGTDVQAYDADLDSLAAGITGPVKGAGNGGGYSAAGYSDMVGLWSTGSCSGYLKSDGNCDGGGAIADIDDLPGDTSNDGYIDPGLVNPKLVRDEIGRAWSAAPTGDELTVGHFYWANNEAAGWDPCTIDGTDDYQVFWNGSDFICIQDINGTLYMSSISEAVPIADSDGTGSLVNSFAFSAERTGTIPGDSNFTYATIPAAGSWKSFYVHPSAFVVDGTVCTAVTSSQINSGPFIYYTACSDGAGWFQAQFSMPENWDGGNLFIELSVFSVQATPDGTVDWDAKVQSRGHDDLINNTWSTAQAIVFTNDTADEIDTQHDMFTKKNTTAIAAGGAGGDFLITHISRDNTDGSIQSVNVAGFKVFYQIDSFEEKD